MDSAKLREKAHDLLNDFDERQLSGFLLFYSSIANVPVLDNVEYTNDINGNKVPIYGELTKNGKSNVDEALSETKNTKTLKTNDDIDKYFESML